ncbi:MAG: type II toxin-antitoxin system VapC family toxin [Candidatus Brockarchaeota archaeon]|nr:type II toxin-antitoxin system VapC family toxin [Candidatus Brockarchaeota archaeon]
MIRILIESNLLLASIKKEDRLKPIAKRILEEIDSGKLKGVYASVATIQEIVFWFYNRQLFDELVKAVNALLHLKNIEWITIRPEICLTASILINEYKVSPFDAYHIATAIFRDRIIISTEHVYDKIKGIKRIDPKELVQKL